MKRELRQVLGKVFRTEDCTDCMCFLDVPDFRCCIGRPEFPKRCSDFNGGDYTPAFFGGYDKGEREWARGR